MQNPNETKTPVYLSTAVIIVLFEILNSTTGDSNKIEQYFNNEIDLIKPFININKFKDEIELLMFVLIRKADFKIRSVLKNQPELVDTKYTPEQHLRSIIQNDFIFKLPNEWKVKYKIKS